MHYISLTLLKFLPKISIYKNMIVDGEDEKENHPTELIKKRQ